MRCLFGFLSVCALGLMPLMGCSETAGGDGGSAGSGGVGGDGGQGGSIPQWGTPQPIETDNAGNAWFPQVAVDSNGNAVAVWHQDDRFSIRSNVYRSGDGWGTADVIDNDSGGAGFAQVAMDAGGRAIAVWQQDDGTDSSIWASRYTPTAGWGAAELIENEPGDAFAPQVALNASGDAMAVWLHTYATSDRVGVNSFTPTGGWRTMWAIDRFLDNEPPQVSMDGSGSAVAVMNHHTCCTSAVLYTPTGGVPWYDGWKFEEVLDQSPESSGGVQVAMNEGGDAVVIWQRSDGTRFDIWTTRLGTSGWSTVERIEASNAGDAQNPQVAIDPEGNAVAVWQQSDGAQTSIWSNRYSVSGGWGEAELLEFDDSGYAGNPSVAMDSRGNAVAVWQQSDGSSYNIWASRYARGIGWGGADMIGATGVGDGGLPEVGMGPDGEAVVVWQQLVDGARYDIWSNRFE